MPQPCRFQSRNTKALNGTIQIWHCHFFGCSCTVDPDKLHVPSGFMRSCAPDTERQCPEYAPEADAGNLQPVPRSADWKLGDMVESALSAVGVTKERVSAWLGEPCHCQERQDRLNALSAWAQKFLVSRATANDLEPVFSDKKQNGEFAIGDC